MCFRVNTVYCNFHTNPAFDPALSLACHYSSAAWYIGALFPTCCNISCYAIWSVFRHASGLPGIIHKMVSSPSKAIVQAKAEPRLSPLWRLGLGLTSTRATLVINAFHTLLIPLDTSVYMTIISQTSSTSSIVVRRSLFNYKYVPTYMTALHISSSLSW